VGATTIATASGSITYGNPAFFINQS